MANNDQQRASQSSLGSRFASLKLGATTPAQDHLADAGGSPYYNNASLPPPPGASGQSASARFERFFNTGQQPETPSYHHQSLPSGLPNNPYASNSIGSNPFGSGAMGAYGSFGPNGNVHNLGVNGIGGSAGSRDRQAAGGRAGIPSQWAADPPLSPHLNVNPTLHPAMSPHSSLHALPQGYYGAPGFEPQPQAPVAGGSGFLRPHRAEASVMSEATGNDEDVIPTAIVVKNIPFSVKSEQLLQIIEDLAIPVPYAFNYHFDQGVFRGLAFANFRSAEEADAVVAALNGFDVSGRKLRVEYKKVLQAGEKERIEKEKALKRMRSMQLEKERVRRDGTDVGGALPGTYPALPISPATGSPVPPPALGVDVGDSEALTGTAGYQEHLSPPTSRAPLTADALRSVPSASNLQPGNGATAGPPSERSGVSKKEELDLNDAQALEIYSRVLLFKDDRMRDELAFSRNLSPQERRTVHLVAQKLNLYHYSIGEAEERHVIVTKHEVRSHAGSRPLRSQASTIGRSQRGDVASAFLAPPGAGAGPLSSGTSSASAPPAQRLRVKKSAPDMKRTRDYHDANGSGSAVNASGAATPSLSLGRKSNGNLRDLRESARRSGTIGSTSQSHSSGGGGIGGAAGLQSLFASPFEVPPVPSLGSSSYANAHDVTRSDSPSIGGNAQGALRQPRGPPTPGQSIESRNFAPRNRVAVQQRHRGLTGESDDPQAAWRPSSTNGSATVDVQSHQPLEI